MLYELRKHDIPLHGYRELSTSDYKSRIDVWHGLVNNWVRGNYPAFRKTKMFHISPPLYLINPDTKNLEKFDPKQKYDQIVQKRIREKSDELTLKEIMEFSRIISNIPKFLKLSELKKYLTDVIGIPL